jgi:hypothetical protein
MSTEVEKLLRRYTPPVRAIARAVRQLVVHTAPDAVEIVRPGWKAITYGTNQGMKSVFCIIHPTRAWVNLEFSRAIDLRDSHRLLEGTGKRMRHVKVASVARAKAPALRALVVEAVKLAAPAH